LIYLSFKHFTLFLYLNTRIATTIGAIVLPLGFLFSHPALFCFFKPLLHTPGCLFLPLNYTKKPALLEAGLGGVIHS
jgi:hypothetical protein